MKHHTSIIMNTSCFQTLRAIFLIGREKNLTLLVLSMNKKKGSLTASNIEKQGEKSKCSSKHLTVSNIIIVNIMITFRIVGFLQFQ